MKVVDKLTNYKLVRKCIFALLFIYYPLIIFSILIASFLGPEGYSIRTNYISDLGSRHYTIAPYLHNLACIIGGILLIPFSFYLIKILISTLENQEESRKLIQLRYWLGIPALIFSVMGNLTYVGVGIVNLDLNMNSIHYMLAGMAFTGFIIGGILIGLLILLFDCKISKLIGLYGILVPIILFVIFLNTGMPLIEWLLLFSIIAWQSILAINIFYKSELIPDLHKN